MYSDVEFIDNNSTELSTNNSGALLEADSDNIFYLADRAEKLIDALNKIMNAALRITTEHDWVVISGKPYLQETGATKVARLFGISWEKLPGVNPEITTDAEGYKTFTYKMRFYMKGDYIDCEGSRSMKDDFFAKTKSGLKKPDEISERNVKQSAYTNAINNGIKRLVPGLRNIDLSDLEKAGIKINRSSGYTYKEGSKGGASKNAENSGVVCADCGVAITQTVASYSTGKYGKPLCMNCQKKVGAESENNQNQQ